MAAALMAALGSWSTLSATNYYSGMRQVTQPDNVTFQACQWGDEFSWEHETDTGYTIIRNPSDSYYYYAILDSLGDYAPSNYKVGIDSPVGIPQHLRRTDPTLAVVCDAEQVILADLDKAQDNRVMYTSGSLENPQIGQRIVDILEGTRPAIENRMAKYRIIFD